MERLIDEIVHLASSISFSKQKVTKDFCKQYAKIFWTFEIPSYESIDDFIDIVYEYLTTTKNRKDFYYQNYLTSKHWYNFKKSIHIENCKCEFCGKTTNLNVHHLNYDWLFHENRRCVVVLCRDCHFSLHQMQNKCKSLITEDLKQIQMNSERNKKMIKFCKDIFTNKLRLDNTIMFCTVMLDKVIPLVADFLKDCNVVSSSIIRYVMPLDDIEPMFNGWYSAYTGKLRQYRIKKGYKQQSYKKKTFSIERQIDYLFYDYCRYLGVRENVSETKKIFIEKISILFERMQNYLLDFTNVDTKTIEQK